MKNGKKRMIKYLSAALTSLTLLPALAVLLPGIKADMPDGMEILSAEDCGNTVVPLGTSYEAVRASLPKETTVKVASAVSAAAAQTLYTAEMNRSDWTLFDSGATSFEAEKFAAVSSSAKMMALTGGEYEDFVIEAKLKGTSEAIDNNFGVMLRATNVTGKNSDAYLGYYVGIGKYGGADALTIGYSENKWHLIKTVPISYQTGKEYTLKVLLYGNRLAVWIDGNLLYQNTLSGGVPAYGKGRVGLRTYKQLFECSSFTVRTASGSELNEAEAVPSVTATAPLGEWYGENYDPEKPGRYVFKAKIASSQREVEASVTVSALKEFTESVSLVPYTDVTINGGFFRDYIKQTVCVILPAAIANVEKPTGGIPNIKNAAKKNRGEPYSAFSGALYVDSDVHKVLESMCYALSADAAGDAEIISAQERIRAKLEEWIPYYIDAQEQSGYFDTYYTLGGMEKYTDITKHELYCMGHFIEAAIAHCESTGGKDTRLFDMAVKCADHLVSTFGYGAGQRKQIAGHQEIEIALLALARYAAAAEDPSLKLRSGRYADLAVFFLELRGDYADRTVTGDKKPYRQDHAPVSEQVSAVGHAVRAEYMYTAMAEFAAIDEEYAKKYDKALTALWKDVSETKQT